MMCRSGIESRWQKAVRNNHGEALPDPDQAIRSTRVSASTRTWSTQPEELQALSWRPKLVA